VNLINLNEKKIMSFSKSLIQLEFGVYLVQWRPAAILSGGMRKLFFANGEVVQGSIQTNTRTLH
jgi:hypothetical protein